jgi:hypothetical protein
VVINTTSGPREADRHHSHTLNTSRVLEEDLTYEDEEAEIAFVLPGDGWHARFDEGVVPLVAWVVLDDGAMYGVMVGEDGTVDAGESVEDRDGFVRYEKQEEK